MTSGNYLVMKGGQIMAYKGWISDFFVETVQVNKYIHPEIQALAAFCS